MKSWCDGPKELLLIAHRLASEGNPASLRAGLVLIDNAVELCAKTFLALPKRVTGVNIGRKELDGIFESFPAVISCLEKNSGDRINSIDLGEIEWYHGLRNKLYHDGSGLTVGKDKIDVYFALASQLFEALFDEKIEITPSTESERLIGTFMAWWVKLEKALIGYSEFVGDTYGRTPNLRAGLGLLMEEGKLPREVFDEITELQRLRNAVVHGQAEPDKAIDAKVLERLRKVDDWLRANDKEYGGRR